jgi:SAM-dependent methyltransferase
MQESAYIEMYQCEDTHWWFSARRVILKKILDSFIAKQAQQTILELGCGTGGNLALLNQYGEVFALEANQSACDMAKTRAIGNIKQGFLPNIPFENNFDLICLFDVLEHIDDEIAVLNTIKQKLNTKGQLLLTVPAYQFLWSAHDVAVNHKRRYTQKSLLALLKQAGFTIQYASYFNTWLFPLIYIIRLIHNITQKKQGTDVAMPSPFMNKLLFFIFKSEAYLLPHITLPFGVSIIVSATKESKD